MPSVERMSTAYTSVDTERPERIGFVRQLGVDTVYVMLGFPLAIVGFCVIVTGLSAGLGLLVVVIGVPILAGTLVRRPLLRRHRAAAYSGGAAAATDPRPTYRAAEPGAGVWRRIVTPLAAEPVLARPHPRHPAFPDRGGDASASWSAGGRSAIGGTLTDRLGLERPARPGQHLARPADRARRQRLRPDRFPDRHRAALPDHPAARGAGCALICRPASAALLLTGVAEMRQTITVLTEQKAAAASAEATALRRLERDIHDGPQQRLVRLVDGPRPGPPAARRRPGGVRATLDEAISQTRETLDELRALSRGIAPPILTDRGLPSALAALAVRCTVPVELASTPSSARRRAGSTRRSRPPRTSSSPRR